MQESISETHISKIRLLRIYIQNVFLKDTHFEHTLVKIYIYKKHFWRANGCVRTWRVLMYKDYVCWLLNSNNCGEFSDGGFRKQEINLEIKKWLSMIFWGACVWESGLCVCLVRTNNKYGGNILSLTWDVMKIISSHIWLLIFHFKIIFINMYH